MRINIYVAQATGLSRRKADEAIGAGRVQINDTNAKVGDKVSEVDVVKLDGREILLSEKQTLMLNKPTGYVVSRNGQGAPTVYDLLPAHAAILKPVGRLDKDSSGLLLMTNDGELAQALTHPSRHKLKIYEVILNRALNPEQEHKIESGILLEDGISRLRLGGFSPDRKSMTVSMEEGRNRQIRRTFDKLGLKVLRLHRTQFGDYELGDLAPGKVRTVNGANK